MELQGYCTIKKDAKTGRGTDELHLFLGKDLRVMEFNEEGDVLVINSEGTCLASFDKIDVVRSFKCGFIDNVLCPPNLNILEQMAYSFKVTSRKGGYNNLLRGMVIQAGLMKGQFNDNFLFAKQ